MIPSERIVRIAAVCLALAVFVILVAPSVDLDPITMRNAGTQTACLTAVYHVPSIALRRAAPLEQLVYRFVHTDTDFTCSRLC